MSSSEAGAVLVVRVWFHDGVPVARLLPQPEDGTTTVAGTEPIIEAVTAWLREVTATPPP